MSLLTIRTSIAIVAAAALLPGLASSATNDDESWYPRAVSRDGATAIVYAPQVDGWEEFESLSAWIAFSIRRSKDEAEYYGTMRFTARTDTDLAERQVLLHDFEIVDLKIDGLGEDTPEYALIRNAFTSMSRRVPLDLVLEYLPRNTQLATATGLDTTPPQIFTSYAPAILLSVDAEPVFLPIGDTGLQFVINTNWDVLREGDSGPVYLCHDDAWLTAPSLGNEWSWAPSLPASFAVVPDDANWKRVRDCLPDPDDTAPPPATDAPAVYFATRPSELLLFDGEPNWVSIGDADLGYAANTQHEVFRAGEEIFVLLSGRWFSADSLAGPWSYRPTLPAVFQAIPPGDGAEVHAKSHVRSSVPGTQEAWEAALTASIPRKADIRRGSEKALNLEVAYAGDPVFAPIDDTGIDLAVNTTYQVLRYDGVYYLCHNAAWLTAPSANGPWTFADSIPEVFATIPPSSPAYNTTFVKIDKSDDDTVEYRYTSGYEGAYVTEDTVVQGTGHTASSVAFAVSMGYYSGYPYPYYPYYWWPPTYGYGSWYDPATGRYGEAVVGYGPYGAGGSAAVYNPQTGVYARGDAVWDNDEIASRGYAHNPNTDTTIAGNRYIDRYEDEGWSQRVAQRGDEWRYTQSEWQDGRMVTEFESSRGTEGTVYRERQGDSIVSEGTISGDDRSATYSSTIADGNLTSTIEGSEGGTGTIDRQLDDGELSGGSTFTKGDETLSTDVTRTAEGVQREFSTSDGGQGVSMRSGEDSAYAFQSAAGDTYAGRDGNVYKKTDDGWAQVRNPGSNASATGQRAYSTTGEPSWKSRERYSSPGAAYESQLNRDFQSRQRGYNRYGNYRSGASRSVPPVSRPIRRR